jgi:hypothetical protein
MGTSSGRDRVSHLGSRGTGKRFLSVKEAWKKWIADLSATRTQLLILVMSMWIWAWADLLIKPHSPDHVLELLKASTPIILGGVFAWITGKVISYADSRREEFYGADEEGGRRSQEEGRDPQL